MTEAASLNFGPAWLRGGEFQTGSGGGGGGAGGGGGGGGGGGNSFFDTGNHTSGNHSFHIGGGGGGSGHSNRLSAIKLAEFRYGREEMLALYSNEPPAPDILEALESASLLASSSGPPLNLMGDLSVEEQKAWQRGANSDQSMRTYSKQEGGPKGPSDRLMGGGGPGGPPGGPGGMTRGVSAGRGRGVGRGGAFFDRHDDELGGRGGSVAGRGLDDGGRSAFGGGRGRSYDRSASWFDREDPSANGGSVSPRKIYSRAPFEDWRKPAGGAAVGGGGSGSGAPTGEVEDGMDVGSGWRGSGPSGRRWNAPSSASGNWRSEQGDQGAGPYRGGPPPPRGDGSGGAYVNGNSRWRDEEGPYRGGRGRATTAFGRQRSRNDGHDLPEWAMDDDDDRAGGAGGTFDASGKFRAPSSESPPPTASSKAGSAPPQESREANGKSDRNTQEASNGGKLRGRHDSHEEEQHFEDEEVDVDDLPPDVRRETLEQRLQADKDAAAAAAAAAAEAKRKEEEAMKRAEEEKKKLQMEQQQLENQKKLQLQQQHQQNLMDDAMAGNLVSSLVDDEPDQRVVASASPPQQQKQPQQQPASQQSPHQPSQQQPPPQEQQQLMYGVEDTKWFYLDPQSNVQGPFSSQDMLDWSKAGYFPNELRLRRACDKRYIQLSEMTKLYKAHDRLPFAPGPWARPAPPPLEDQSKEDMVTEVSARVKYHQDMHLRMQQLELLRQQASESNNVNLLQVVIQKQQEIQREQEHNSTKLNQMMQRLSLLQNQNPPATQQQQQQPQVPMPPQQQQQQQMPGSELGMLFKQQPMQQHHQAGLGAFGMSMNQGGVIKTGSTSSLGEMLQHQQQHQQQSLHHPGQPGPHGQMSRQLLHQQQQQQQQEAPSMGPGSLGLLGGPGAVQMGGLQQPTIQPQPHPQHIQQQQSQQPHPESPVASGAPYDPIKSLLTQLQQSDHEDQEAGDHHPHRQASPPSAATVPQPQKTRTPFSSGGSNPSAQHTNRPQHSPETPQAPPRSIWDQEDRFQRTTEIPPAQTDSADFWGQRPAVVAEHASHQQQQHVDNDWQQQPREPTPSDRVDSLQQSQLPEEQQQQPSKPAAAASAGGPPSGQPPFPAAASAAAVDPTNEDSFSNNDTKVAAVVAPPVTPNNKKADKKKGKRGGKEEDKKKQKQQQQQQKVNNSNNNGSDQKYIPGMEGTVRPDEPVQSMEEEANLAQAEALTRLKMEQQQMLEREQATLQLAAAEKQRAEAAQSAARLAPWAKKAQAEVGAGVVAVNGGHAMTSGAPGGGDSGLSLAEIQKLEEERERELQIQREIEEQQMREIRRREEEENSKRQQNRAMNWASTAASGVTSQPTSKSLAEIQAEEAAKERERQEREKQQKRARQKEMGLAQASVWGSASANLSWASKAATTAPPPTAAAAATVANPSNKAAKSKPQQQQQQQQQQAWNGSNNISDGFWDDAPVPGLHPASAASSGQSGHGNKKKKNAQNKKAKEDAKVAAIFREQKKPVNEFEAWCTQALQNLHAQIDIPTFMAFLNDIESPYEVNDYVKSYVGEGKGPKNFAKEYMERRSKWKNSMKSAQQPEDDLLTPAHAINPNAPDDVAMGLGSGGGGGPGGSGKKGKKGKVGGGKKMDASFLLGFSVSSSDRVNAGDIDLPQ